MPTAIHSAMTLTQVHQPYSFSYATAALRTAATGFLAADVGKIARQTDENSLWLLTGYSPISWQRIILLDSAGKLPAVDGSQLTGISFSLPAGFVIAMAAETVPTGYLECNGAAVSRTTYSALYSAIGVTHGYGNNSTTFNIPDYRGRFLRGWDHSAARDPDCASRTAMNTGGLTGDRVGSVQADAFKIHTHGGNVWQDGSSFTGLSSGEGGVSAALASTGGSETRPTNANVMFCIKY